MNTVEKYRSVLNFIEDILRDACFIEANQGQKISAVMLNVSLEHAQGVCVLLENKIYTSAMALMRVQFEAYIRAMWLGSCATKNEISMFLKKDEIVRDDKRKPTFSLLVNEVEKYNNLQSLLSNVCKDNMKSFHSFAHGGVGPLIYNYGGNTISHQYSNEEVNQMARYSNLFACLTFCEILKIIDVNDKEKIEENILSQVSDWAFKKN